MTTQPEPEKAIGQSGASTSTPCPHEKYHVFIYVGPFPAAEGGWYVSEGRACLDCRHDWWVEIPWEEYQARHGVKVND